MEKLMITAALTGNIILPTQTPCLPITPQQIIDDAVRAADAPWALASGCRSFFRIEVRKVVSYRKTVEWNYAQRTFFTPEETAYTLMLLLLGSAGKMKKPCRLVS